MSQRANYQLFAEILKGGLDNLSAKRRDHTFGYARVTRVTLSASEVSNYHLPQVTKLARIGMSLGAVLSPACQELMFGQDSQGDNRDHILYGGSRLVEIYEQILDWASDIRGTAVAGEKAQKLLAALARLATGLLTQIEQLLPQFERAAQGTPIGHVRLTLTLDFEELDVELNKLGLPPLGQPR